MPQVRITPACLWVGNQAEQIGLVVLAERGQIIGEAELRKGWQEPDVRSGRRGEEDELDPW
jgi:hypothetical protein